MKDRSKRSTQPSATKSERLLEDTVFFIDRGLGRELGLELRKSGMKIELYKDHFDESKAEESDVFWIKEVTSRGWVIFTKDHRILTKNGPERIAAKACGATIFALPRGHISGDEMLARYLDNKIKIGRMLKNHGKRFFALVYKNDVKLDQKD